MKKILVASILIIALISGCTSSDNGNGNGTEACVAGFTASPVSGTAPLEVQFTDQSTGDIASWAWTFGDGDTSTEQNPSHIYEEGTYTVLLKVTGPGGSDEETRVGYITVSPKLLPDLVITGYTRNPTSDIVAPGTTVQFNFQIQNQGQADVPSDSHIRVADPLNRDGGITGGLQVNQTKTVTVDYPFVTPNATYDLIFFVDPDDTIEESNENNNYSVTITVQTTD